MSGEARRLAVLVHREMVQLAILLALAVAAFLATRALAASSRRLGERDAAEWFRRGQAALASGRTGDATDAFRRATVRRRGDRTYGLALARSLAAEGNASAAVRELLELRETAPEDPDINLTLARVSAASGDVAAARRFYEHSLYAAWPDGRTSERTAVRLETARFLIDHGDRPRALAELLAASPSVAADASHQNEIARLLASAGADRRALQHFRQALAALPDDQAALAGAGMAAFRLQDYQVARTLLRRVTMPEPSVLEMRELTALVLDGDPLAPRIGGTERRRRLAAAVERVQQRLALCAPPETASADVASVRAGIDGLAARLARTPALDQDMVEEGLELLVRATERANERCGSETAEDRALLLTERLHRERSR
jgi:tetratricopeptide (TPR) repeat protein